MTFSHWVLMPPLVDVEPQNFFSLSLYYGFFQRRGECKPAAIILTLFRHIQLHDHHPWTYIYTYPIPFAPYLFFSSLFYHDLPPPFFCSDSLLLLTSYHAAIAIYTLILSVHPFCSSVRPCCARPPFMNPIYD